MAGRPQYSKPSDQVDLEAFLERDRGEEKAPEDDSRSFAVKGNDLDGYVGTEPERMTYSNETEKPLLAQGDSPVAEHEREVVETQVVDSPDPVLVHPSTPDPDTDKAVQQTSKDELTEEPGSTGQRPLPTA